MQCDVRVADDKSPWLENTKCVVLLGEYAMHHWVPSTRDNTLNEMRGSPLVTRNNIPAIATFFPQDAADFKSYEQQYNTESKEYVGDEATDDKDDEGDVKRFSPTKRSNYAFWIKADLGKCKRILKDGGVVKRDYSEPKYKIYPSSDEVINILQTTENQWLDFDIETDYEEQNLLCFSFTFDGVNIYCVPVLNHEYQWAYSGLHYILRALDRAIRRNRLVCHNGAGFDFPVLGWKYQIPIYETWDTMIAMHRCFPDIEKSLGHVTSYWINEIFHKDSDSRSYFTAEHVNKKLLYCGKDVYTMSWIRTAIQKYAKTIPGLEESIAVAQRSIRPYTICSLQGIPYDEQLRQSKISTNDRLMTQYLRIINLLIGEAGMEQIKSCLKGKAKSTFPSSNKQCVEYFHNILGYPIVQRNPPDQHGVRNVSLAKRAMLKLRLKNENPVIDLVNAYRYTRLETTTPLGFTPWKDENNKIIKPTSD